MEILFRGKRIDNDEWIIGDLLQINGKSYIYPLEYGDLDDIDFGSSFVEVNKYTIGRYCGLLDLYWDRIFDGDIVKYEYDNGEGLSILREYGEGIGIIECRKYGIYLNSITNQNHKTFLINLENVEDNTMEVIGNIYDNEELFKSDKYE